MSISFTFEFHQEKMYADDIDCSSLEELKFRPPPLNVNVFHLHSLIKRVHV